MEPRATAPPTDPPAPPPSPPWAPPFGATGGGRGLPPTAPQPRALLTFRAAAAGAPPGRARAALVGGVAATAMLAGSVGGWLASSARPDATASPVAVERASLELAGDGLDVGEVLARVEPSVVSIETELATTGRGPWDAGGTATGAGTGIVLDTDGSILTNAHVDRRGEHDHRHHPRLELAAHRHRRRVRRTEPTSRCSRSTTRAGSSPRRSARRPTCRWATTSSPSATPWPSKAA